MYYKRETQGMNQKGRPEAAFFFSKHATPVGTKFYGTCRAIVC